MPRYAELSPVLLAQKCAGSKDADLWAEFIRRFQPVIAAAVLRTTRRFGDPPRQLVDDLIQDAYLKLCENDCRLLRGFQVRGEDSIYGFLKVVAANIVHDHFKSAMAEKRGASQTEAIVDPEGIDPRSQGTDSEESIHRSLRLEEIDRILREVTAGKDQERKCRIFWLRHRHGFTAAEIAALPGIELSPEGVESVLLRLSTMIRGHMAEKVKNPK